MLTAVSALIYFVFLLAAPSLCSAVLLCLPVSVWLFVWPFSSTVPGFQQCTFLQQTCYPCPIPSMLLFCSLIYDSTFFRVPFPRVSLALRLRSISQDLCLYFRAGLKSGICHVLIVLENSSIGGFNWILIFAFPKLQKVSQVV